MAGPSISVVVCSYNGASKIAHCLELLESQVVKPREIIVVSDGSTDNTAQIARNFTVSVLEIPVNEGLSSARNRGVAAARGEIVAFIDDDVRVDQFWVERLTKLWLRAPRGVVGIGGYVRPTETESLNGLFCAIRVPLRPVLLLEKSQKAFFLFRVARYLDCLPAGFAAEWAESLVGASMSFRANALGEIAGFNPLIRFGGDEEYLCARLRERFGQHSLKIDEGLSVAHDFGTSISDSWRRSFAYGRGATARARDGVGPWPYPSPVGMISLLALAIAPWLAVVSAVLLSLAFIAQLGRLSRAKSIDSRRFLVPWIIAIEEVFNLVGMLYGALALRRNRTMRSIL